MTDTSIKVDESTRNRLNLIARDQGKTVKDLVAELAEGTPTSAELQARFEAARDYIRSHLCPELTDDDIEAGQRLLDEILADDGGHVAA